MRAATEESAISQALMIVGAARDEVSVEVIERNDKGVTVRVSPRVADEPEAQPQAQEPEFSPEDDAESIEAQVDDVLASEADDEAPELASEEVVAEVEAITEDEVTFAESASEDEESQSTDEAQAEDAPTLEQIVEDEAVLEPLLFVADTEASVEPEVEAASTYIIPQEVRERSLSAAQAILGKMGLEASASLVSHPFSAIEEGDPDAQKRIYVAVDGQDVSILIGKHGATLHAFQYLSLNNRGEASGTTGDDAVRVVVDAGGYRSRRAEMLERMTQETAARAKREGRALRMEAMPAHERRLVHMFLRDDTSISTSSEGREPQRFVVVAPAGHSYEPSRSSGQRYGNEGYGGRGGYGNRRGRR
jgi:spoIIIJ-associated protein